MDFEEFQIRTQFYWCNVRGKRYQVHDSIYLEDMFLPHTEVLQELFGISSDNFVTEIKKILHTFSFGIQVLLEDLYQFQHDTMNAIAKKVDELPSDDKPNPPDLMADVIKRKCLGRAQKRYLWTLSGHETIRCPRDN